MRHFTAEDYKAMPLAAVGLVKGIGAVIIAPILRDVVGRYVGDKSDLPVKRVSASIQYYPPRVQDGVQDESA